MQRSVVTNFAFKCQLFYRLHENASPLLDSVDDEITFDLPLQHQANSLPVLDHPDTVETSSVSVEAETATTVDESDNASPAVEHATDHSVESDISRTENDSNGILAATEHADSFFFASENESNDTFDDVVFANRNDNQSTEIRSEEIGENNVSAEDDINAHAISKNNVSAEVDTNAEVNTCAELPEQLSSQLQSDVKDYLPSVVMNSEDSLALNSLFNVDSSAEKTYDNVTQPTENSNQNDFRFKHLKLARNEKANINANGVIEVTRIVDSDCVVTYIYGQDIIPVNVGPEVKIKDVISGNIPFKSNVSVFIVMVLYII